MRNIFERVVAFGLLFSSVFYVTQTTCAAPKTTTNLNICANKITGKFAAKTKCGNSETAVSNSTIISALKQSGGAAPSFDACSKTRLPASTGLSATPTVTFDCANPEAEYLFSWGVVPSSPGSSTIKVSYSFSRYSGNRPTGVEIHAVGGEETFNVELLCCPIK